MTWISDFITKRYFLLKVKGCDVALDHHHYEKLHLIVKKLWFPWKKIVFDPKITDKTDKNYR